MPGGEWLGNTIMGDASKIAGSTLKGFNSGTRYLPPIKDPKDHMGFTFFTRPQLNLSTVNIKNIRQFLPLLTNKSESIQRYARTMLDPRLLYGLSNTTFGSFYNNEKLSCSLVDKFNPFIPVLSNLLKTMSGWPDMVVPSFTSSAGLRKEQISLIDGTFEIFDTFDISCTFRNIVNEPLTMLFQTWIQYASLVFEGMIYPYLDFVSEFEIDYNTRIYRFITDDTGRHIKKAACTGAAFPKNVPLGKFYDYNREELYNTQTSEINISFTSMGALYNDVKIFYAFNKTWSIFNPSIKKWLKGDKDSSGLEVVPYELLPKLNYRAYPIIDMYNNEIVWLIDKSDPQYKLLIKLATPKTVTVNSTTSTNSTSNSSNSSSGYENINNIISVDEAASMTTTNDVIK